MAYLSFSPSPPLDHARHRRRFPTYSFVHSHDGSWQPNSSDDFNDDAPTTELIANKTDQDVHSLSPINEGQQARKLS